MDSVTPGARVGDQCESPYACPFIDYCFEPGPEYPVTCIADGKKIVQALLAEGIRDIKDISGEKPSKIVHQRVHRVTKRGEAKIDPSVVDVLEQFSHPRYYSDFETVAFAVPIWAGANPYEPIPSQLSCHIGYADGQIEHTWFLETSSGPPMRPVAKRLLRELDHSEPIFMYTPFEKRCITYVIEQFPDLAPKLTGLKERLVDLHPIVKEHYYHPDMKGSWSLKSIAA